MTFQSVIMEKLVHLVIVWMHNYLCQSSVLYASASFLARKPACVNAKDLEHCYLNVI